MINIADFTYDKNGVDNIKEWGFGQNWPVVYIIYNDNTAYVGETLDAVRRTEQHFSEKEFDAFNKMCLISGRTYNKSVILDLESFLIKYMSADGSKKLTNGNAGVADHDYFYKEAYKDDFKEIWEELIKKGIVKKTLLDIENSELYKYSPYKSLNLEQQKAAYDILKSLAQMNKTRTSRLLYMVKGGAGTGKSILAVFIVKLLVDISKDKKVWNAISDSEDALFIQKISGELNGIKKIGFVVPMIELRNTMKSIFKSIDGLTEDMVLAPEEVIKEHYDILVVDEAHRLYRRKNLPGVRLYTKFDEINKSLMLESFTGTEDDYTELDWIIKSSEMQILFYDEYQTIRVTDIGSERFEAICAPHLFKYYNLFSQMRCKGGNGYYEYIKDVIEKKGLDISKYKKIKNYELKVLDGIEDLFSIVNKKNTTNSLSKVVTGPGWSIAETIMIEGKKYNWASGKNDNRDDVIFSIHKTQGFDLNYVGVIFGKEVYYNNDSKMIEINKKEVRDNFTKSNGDDYMRECILHIYVTLMTRGIDGAYVYAVDDNLREYLKKFLN